MYRARTIGQNDYEGQEQQQQEQTPPKVTMNPFLSLGLTVGGLIMGSMFLGGFGKPKVEGGTTRKKLKRTPTAQAQTPPARQQKRRKKTKSIAGKVNSKIRKLGRKSKSRKRR
jgi:hypothetical protein